MTEPQVLIERPRARANARVFFACSQPGCEIIAKTNGLCNRHYMDYYRESLAKLNDEVTRAVKHLGLPSDYFCEDHDCDSVASKWYVQDGTTPIALCADHVGSSIESMRMNLRRLELKS